MKTAPYLIRCFQSRPKCHDTASVAQCTLRGASIHSFPSAPRTIIVLDSDTPPIIRAGLAPIDPHPAAR